jgi:hypothetical protein
MTAGDLSLCNGMATRMTPWRNRVVSYRGNNVKLAKKEKKTKKKD